MSIYEFFIIIGFIFSMIFYLKKKSDFTNFLINWSFITLLAYIIASEKMPWLMVHISLPLICITGYALGDNIFILKSVLLDNFRIKYKNFITKNQVYVYTVTLLIIIMFIFSVIVGFRATYIHSDKPLGPIVYTQTSSDILKLSDDITDWSIKSGDFENLPILIDTTSGYTWPWQWYLREFKNVHWADFSNFNSDNISYYKSVLSNREIIIIHEQNLSKVKSILNNGYKEPLKIRHRSWFPEEVYRSFNIEDILKYGFWNKVFKYIIFNEGLDSKIGSENSFVIISNNLPE